MKSITCPSQQLLIWVRARSFNHNVIKIKLQSSFITLHLKNDKVSDIFSLFLQYLDHFKFNLDPWAIILKRNSIVYNMSSNSSRSSDHILVNLRSNSGWLWSNFEKCLEMLILIQNDEIYKLGEFFTLTMSQLGQSLLDMGILVIWAL